jgi:hypothetical protein
VQPLHFVPFFGAFSFHAMMAGLLFLQGDQRLGSFQVSIVGEIGVAIKIIAIGLVS